MIYKQKIVKADNRLRIIGLILIILILLACFVTYNLFQKYYKQVQIVAESNPELAIVKMASILKAIVYINPIIFFLFFLYFITMGTKTYRSQQYPPPGVKVIRDTYIVEGKKAKIYGIGLWVVAFILVLFAIVFFLLMNNFINTLI